MRDLALANVTGSSPLTAFVLDWTAMAFGNDRSAVGVVDQERALDGLANASPVYRTVTMCAMNIGWHRIASFVGYALEDAILTHDPGMGLVSSKVNMVLE